ncbi:hypothetical protein AB9E21_00255 [Rhizobium leguminosarum]
MEQWLFDKDISSQQLFVVDRLPVQSDARRQKDGYHLPVRKLIRIHRCTAVIASFLAGCAQRSLQQPETRPPLLVEHNCPAIDDHQRRPHADAKRPVQRPFCNLNDFARSNLYLYDRTAGPILATSVPKTPP